MRLGLQRYGRRRWTANEDAALQAMLARTSTKGIARKLGRTVLAVQSRAEQLRMSSRVMKGGYGLADLQDALGASRERVHGWVRRGLLGDVAVHEGMRISPATVERFIRRYTDEYDLRRVDQMWFKGMIFGRYGR